MRTLRSLVPVRAAMRFALSGAPPCARAMSGVLTLSLVEGVADTGGVIDVLRASKGDEGAGGVVDLGLGGVACAGVVAGVDGGGGEAAGEAGV